MKESNLRAWQVLFLFVAVLIYILYSGGTAHESFISPVSKSSSSVCTSSTCKASLYSLRQLNVPTPTILKKISENKIAATAQINQKPQQAGGYCILIPVLLYHHIRPQAEAFLKKQNSLNVDPGFFDLQMKYLTERGYNTIFADVLINSLKTHSPIPGKSILVTVDDGYGDFFQNAFPIIQKYGIKVNLMIATGLIGGEDNMSWDQISQIKGSGLAYFIDHTWSHYAINHGSTDKIQYEIQTGKQQLEEHTGQSVNIFAYPYGSFNNNAISILQSDGFTGAFSTIGGSLQCDSFIMTLHRNHVGNAPLSSYGL